jgi:hypothetical protein
MSWRDDTEPEIVADLDVLSAGVHQQANSLLVHASRFTPFAVTLRAQGLVLAESTLEIAQAQTALSDPDVRAVCVVSTDRGHAAHWVRLRMQHRLGGPRVEIITDFRRSGVFQKRISYEPSVESVVDGGGPLASQFEIDQARTRE